MGSYSERDRKLEQFLNELDEDSGFLHSDGFMLFMCVLTTLTCVAVFLIAVVWGTNQRHEFQKECLMDGNSEFECNVMWKDLND